MENLDKCHIARVGSLRLCLCRKCAGHHCRQLIAYIRDFGRRFPTVRKPKDPMLPLGGEDHGYRCRNSECQCRLHDWRPGAPPFCDLCIQEGKAQPASATPFPGSQSERASSKP